jgi:hypothetical protein
MTDYLRYQQYNKNNFNKINSMIISLTLLYNSKTSYNLACGCWKLKSKYVGYDIIWDCGVYFLKYFLLENILK